MADVEVKGDLNFSLDWLEQNGKRYFQSALYRGADVLKKQAKANFSSSLPAATHQNPRYMDTLLDAIRNTHSEGDFVVVHTLGTPQSGSGTYRARFFEKGTIDRYQKTYAGIPLKKKRFLGRISPPLRFFSSAVTSTQSQVLAAMQQSIDFMIKKANEENGNR